MTKVKTLSALGAIALSLIGAGQASANPVYITNHTPGAIWVTVYLYGDNQQKQDWFCVLPGGWGESNKNVYNYINYVYVQAEIKKESQNCDDHSNAYRSANNGVNTAMAPGGAMITFSSSNVYSSPGVSVTAY